MNRNNEIHTFEGWPDARYYNRSIRTQFSVLVAFIILVLMLITGYIMTRKFVTAATNYTLKALLIQARSFSSTAGKHIISTNTPDRLMLSDICSKLTEDNPEIYWAGVAGTDSVFLAHTDIKQVVKKGKVPHLTTNKSTDLLKTNEVFTVHLDTIYVVIPILEENVMLGNLVLASSSKSIAHAKRVSMITVMSITLFMLLVGIPVTMFTLRRKLQSISVITDTLKHIDINNISLSIPITDKNEIGYLASTLQVMGDKLNLAREELIEKKRIAQELQIAREIQINMLPSSYPQEQQFEIYGTYKSAKEVGGDYYDFIPFDNNHLGIIVADVSGKSLPAMLVMLQTRDVLKNLTRTHREPAELLSLANLEIYRNIKEGMFVTMLFGLLDKKTGTLTFASAGHTAPILVTDHSENGQRLKTKGYPLGMMPPDLFDKRIERKTVQMNENNWFILYTDGINEAQNLSGHQYGINRLMESIEANRNVSAKHFVKNILTDHQEFVGQAPQFDDLTLISLKWTACTTQKNKLIVESTANGY